MRKMPCNDLIFKEVGAVFSLKYDVSGTVCPHYRTTLTMRLQIGNKTGGSLL